MVRAELTYNPYLLKTEIKFNGDPPRINSLVEKYENQNLQTWVNLIPAIFYDEMNGYGFILEFNGTDLDYSELEKSFVRAGVGKDKVQLLHRGTLGSRKEKNESLNLLLEWLDENRNKRFDFEAFSSANKDLFERVYPLALIGGIADDSELFSDISVDVDSINSADELQNTDLYNTPIVLYIDKKSLPVLRHNIRTLLERSDISLNQLFFIISPAVDNQIEREIQDLGIYELQKVDSLSDSEIHRYIELFPMSDSIHNTLDVIKKEADEIEKELDEDNRANEINNSDTHDKLKRIENIIGRLKETSNKLNDVGELEESEDLSGAKNALLTSVKEWKIKKTKIIKIDEAKRLSQEYESDVNKYYEKFCVDARDIYSRCCDSLIVKCRDLYHEAEYDETFDTDSIQPLVLNNYVIPPLAGDLMEIKEEQFYLPKEDLFGKIFKQSQDNGIYEMHSTTTFYYEKWREYVSDVVNSVAELVIDNVNSNLLDFYDRLSERYCGHIDEIIHELLGEKTKITSRLSDEEKNLQQDNEWFMALCEHISGIERG